MSPWSILLLLVGVWVLVNAINGNLPGLVQGTVKFNTPGSVPAGTPTSPNAVNNTNSNFGASPQGRGTSNTQTGSLQPGQPS